MSFDENSGEALSLYMRASCGREHMGFIAEIIVFPTAQYLLTDTYIEVSDSTLVGNQLGALDYSSAGERNANVYVLRNRVTHNGVRYFNATTRATINAHVQNTPKFYLGNNYVAHNWGGTRLRLYSGSGVLLTTTLVFNNLFYANRNGTCLDAHGELQLPYNELLVDKNTWLENETPRTELVRVQALLSKFTRNQLVYNRAARILYTRGFENVSTPRHQDVSFNMMRDNYAYGIVNDLEDPMRFRATMVAASLKQTYHANYLFNKDNDFELTALVDPAAQAFEAASRRRARPPAHYWHELYEPSMYEKLSREEEPALYDKSAHASFDPNLPSDLRIDSSWVSFYILYS